MFYAYLFATVVGALLLAVSLFGGGDHDADHGGGGHDDHGDGDAGAFGFFLSIRLWTYVLAFGGATGLLLRLVAGGGEPVTGLLAGGVGLAAGLLSRALFSRASRERAPSTVRADDLVGKTGVVLVPFDKGKTGQVRVLVRGADHDLLATTDEAGELARQTKVLVIELRDGTAVVERSED